MSEKRFVIDSDDLALPSASIKKFLLQQYSVLFEQNPNIFEYLRKYKSDAYYFDVNGVARKGSAEYTRWLVRMGQPESDASIRVAKANEILSELGTLFESSILPEPLSVYRQVSANTLRMIIECRNSFSDDGFVSTCFTLEDAKKYHKRNTIRIDLPKGTRVVDMTSALKFTDWHRDAEWEGELTIDRGYTFKVIDEPTDDYSVRLELQN